MNKTRWQGLATAVLALIGCALAQQVSKHVLSADELKKAVPAEYFFRGQKAQVFGHGVLRGGATVDDAIF